MKKISRTVLHSVGGLAVYLYLLAGILHRFGGTFPDPLRAELACDGLLQASPVVLAIGISATLIASLLPHETEKPG
ncbi:MAG: hypothetical protein IKI50_05605 [Clostridia bacterium]|nr:hypothetical protein [Clostridia bacterium]